MNKQKSIIWLASYPKSGNTWVRAFLSRILFTTSNINQLNIPIYSSKSLLEQHADIDISEMPLEYLHRLRLQVFQDIASQQNILPIKIHDKFLLEYYQMPFLPFDYSFVALYIVRNPFDVCISFSRHLGKTINETIEIMNNPNYTLASSLIKYQIQLPQLLGTWSEHIESWLNQSTIPVYIIRYEDMLHQPYKTFSNILDTCQIPYTSDQLNDAINFSSFSNLQQLEQKYGFEEKSVHSTLFFHTGKSYYYREILTNQQIEKIFNNHSHIIQKLGYETS
ncbi:MAG: sulfotransferase domain-containing protein [Bacteroidales bacterium]|nr:sulfotransferase domain-containing protein [Bacteroidales bacterium]